MEACLAPHRRELCAREPGLDEVHMLRAWHRQFGGYEFGGGGPHLHNPYTLLRAVQHALAGPDGLRDAAGGLWVSAWPEVVPANLQAVLSHRMCVRKDELTSLRSGGFPALMVDLGFFSLRDAGGKETLVIPNVETALACVNDILQLPLSLDSDVQDGVIKRLRLALEDGSASTFVNQLGKFAAHHRLVEIWDDIHVARTSLHLLLHALLKCADVDVFSDGLSLGRLQVHMGDFTYMFDCRPSLSARRVGSTG